MTSFGKQDSTFDDYLRPHWPAIESREVATTVWGYFAREVVADEDRRFLGPEWTRENITAAGPIGAAYRVWGDGLQMAEGFDDEDYFGLSGLSAGELAERGYTVWMPPQERGGFISEGDSSNFALLVDNGLRSWEHPGWGGWGGRQGPVPGDPAGWSNEEATDAGPDGRPRKDWSAARWAGEFHQDFAARLRWSTSSEFAAANHHPCVAVVEGTMLTAQPGATVRLTAEVSDPDGDAVGVTWWQYLEAGTSRAVLDLRADLTSVEFEIPADATPGETLHLICSATDTGAPPLTRHQRVVLTVVATQA
ncbi:nucleoside hydrolase-like domain-containing protein [Tessaracoccus aquimaris]|uniref:nucleoside hydrolase-like domain-containing protein n=1 Tax=Tessaracoccus aquimaris TaxID=1332264 RepID=UPI00202A750D|nr:nucleoside hydrolase-like domain-containing protein [Tessaracoccus aquimaris]